MRAEDVPDEAGAVEAPRREPAPEVVQADEALRLGDDRRGRRLQRRARRRRPSRRRPACGRPRRRRSTLTSGRRRPVAERQRPSVARAAATSATRTTTCTPGAVEVRRELGDAAASRDSRAGPAGRARRRTATFAHPPLRASTVTFCPYSACVCTCESSHTRDAVVERLRFHAVEVDRVRRATDGRSRGRGSAPSRASRPRRRSPRGRPASASRPPARRTRAQQADDGDARACALRYAVEEVVARARASRR